MRRVLFLAVASALCGQNSPPPAQAPASEEAPARFKTSVDLVTVPVVVRDSEGHAAGGFRAEDFQITDNGKEQTISRFSVESRDAPAKVEAGTLARAPLPPSVQPARFFAFLIDDQRLEGTNFRQVVAAAGRQLRALLPGDRAAVLSTSGRTTTEFTSDQDKLQAALAGIVPAPRRQAANACPDIGYYQADLIVNRQDRAAINVAVREARACMPALTGLQGQTSSQWSMEPRALQQSARTSDMIEQVVISAARAVLGAGEQETRVAISALLDAIQRLQVMAGRRHLVLVSPGFLKPGLQREVSNTIQRAIQANVTIHAIDARGLFADPAAPGGGMASNMEAERDRNSLASDAMSSASDVMVELTRGSGGRLFRNSNTLDAGFQQVTNVPEYEYTLSFTPQGLKPDGKYHALKVSLKGHPGLSVETRKGYFAPRRDPDPAKQAKLEIQAEIFSREERKDLNVDVAARIVRDSGKGASETKNVLVVFTRLDLKTLGFRRAGDRYSNEVRTVAALFDPNGNIVAAKEQLASLNLGGKELEKHRETGVVLRTDLDLKPGRYLLRVVARESEGQRLASRTRAIMFAAGERGTQAADELWASLPEGKKQPSPAWKPAEAPPPEPEEPEEPLSPNIDLVEVPGGLAALARIVNLPSTPSPEKFFLEYCRDLAAASGPARPGAIHPPLPAMASYLAGVAELSQFAEPESRRVRLTIEESAKTIRVLKMLGWDVIGDWASETGAGSAGFDIHRKFRIEPGDAVADSSRQDASAALGIDEIAMTDALAAGQSYTIVVPSGRAQFIQARLWSKLAGTLPPGGFAELFARRVDFARAYAGLAAMNFDAANAVISSVGLRPLVERYANIVLLFGDSFAVSNGRVAVPGGAEAQPAWEKLTGASTRDPKAFFRALIQKDGGRLAEFYFAVWRGGPAQQRFFTANSERVARFYRWFRDEHARSGPGAAWQEEFVRGLPVDDAGRVRFPGGRLAWTSGAAPDDAALLDLASLRALVPVALLEEARKAPLDVESARLLSARYTAWRGLFPYFEKLKGLGAAEFSALEKFEKAVSKAPRPAQNSIMGQWHSLVKLAELAAQAGSLDDAEAAQAFRRACEALSQPDFSTAAVAALREMLHNPGDPDEAVPVALLRLDEVGRTAFQEVKELQHVPPISSTAGSPNRTLSALAGLVYAATLDPDSLLLVEDPALLSRHQFTYPDAPCGLFCPSKSNVRSGSSHFLGGFAGFEAEARIATREKIRRGNTETRRGDVRGVSSSGTRSDFQVSARVVEAYATVTYGKGRHADGLRETDFKVLDNGKPVRLSGFESDTSAVSVALLLDMSRSMTGALASLRKSAFSLVGNLRPIDSVAVFGFSDSVFELQPWTLDKAAAKRALLRATVMDRTELHDALLRLIHELSGRKGKKVIVVFTDGNDTASAIGADAVIRRAKENSIRIYTVAEGDALKYPELLSGLENLATATGGLSFAVREPSKMAAAFETISFDLAHGYLLTIRPEPDPSRRWHSLQVVLTSARDGTVRARQGYYGTP